MPDRLRITGKAVYDELVSRGIQVEILDARTGLLKFTVDGTSRYVQSCLTDTSSPVGRNISDHKSLASKVADSLGLQQPAEVFYTDDLEATRFLDEHKTLVVKPNDGAHGKGVTVGVTTIEQLQAAVAVAKGASRSKKILIQQQVYGSDVRILIIGGTLAAASLRSPASVDGDGTDTISGLVEKENTNPLRGSNYRMPLNYIDTKLAAQYLGASFETQVPADGENVQVAGTANIGTGGKATDITDEVPKEIVEQARRIARELEQDCCGVDFITSDISDESQYYFLEINASPSFGLHMKPSEGKPRDVQKMFVDMLLATS